MSDSYNLINVQQNNNIVVVYPKDFKENEQPLNNEIEITGKCILIKLIIFVIAVFLIYLFFSLKNKNKIDEKSNEQILLNNDDNYIDNINEEKDVNNINDIKEINFLDNNGIITHEKMNDKALCKNLEPITMFKLRIKNGPKTICKNRKSEHICYQNLNNYYNSILWHPNGTICLMKNIIIDPSKAEKTGLIYKGPVDPENKGSPILSKGFFNMNCKNRKKLEIFHNIYNNYFDSWDYDYTNKEKIEELAPGKTIFFLSRNQDSPNLYHGNTEIINVISMMDLFNIKPENIQVIFLESLTIKNDPFYDIYKNVISRGGNPIYIHDLKKKYHISSSIHIPINWDSTCFFTLDPNNQNHIPYCKKPGKAYKLYNDLIDKYMKISNFTDPFISNDIFYYPKSVINNYKLKKTKFVKKVTVQWRRVWPKGRIGQSRLLGNGKQLADKLSSILPKNFLVRLVNTASLPIKEQISIMRDTDYFIGIHGAGLTLSIFMPYNSIIHEILHNDNIKVLVMMSSLSGHKTYSDIVNAKVNNNGGNENVFFNVNDFGKKVLKHMKENHYF